MSKPKRPEAPTPRQRDRDALVHDLAVLVRAYVRRQREQTMTPQTPAPTRRKAKQGGKR